MKINGGQLLVQGDYRLQSRTGVEGAYTYGSSTGELIMQKEGDKVTVLGSVLMNTTVPTDGKLTAGTLEVQGNFTQLGGSTYQASGSNTLLFSGKKSQVWSHTVAPTLANLVNRNSKRLTISTSPVITGTVTDETKNITTNGTILINSTDQITNGYCGGNIQINGNDVLQRNLKIAALYLAEGATLSAGNYTIEAQSITLNGSLYVQEGRIVCTDDFVMNTEGRLVMQEADGNVLVGGDFKITSKHNHSGYLTDGVLEIRGHFEQSSYINFVATNKHTVVLSSKKTTTGKNLVQNIAFHYGAGTTRFHKLVLTKNNEGYYFKNEPETIADEVIYEPEDTQAPTGISCLEATEIGVTSVTLSYDGAEDSSGVLGYEIYRDGVRVAVTGATLYTDTGLSPSTEYTYKVYPFDNFRNIAMESPELTIKTADDTLSPSVPEGLAVSTRTGSAITLSWNAATDNAGEVSYILYRDGERLAEGLKETTYKDSGLERNKVYRYCVAAQDAAGNTSANSKVVEGVVAMPEITEVSPKDYSGIGGDKVTIMVKFKNVGNAQGNSVRMEYAGADGQWQMLAPALLGQKTYNNTTLYAEYNWNISKLNGDYNIRYTLYDADKNTDVEEVTYHIDREAPQVPENISARSQDGTITIYWEASTSADCQ